MTDWEKISYIAASQPRFRVFLELIKNESTPTQLSDRLGIPVSHVSKALRELTDQRVVECLTPDRRKMKFYGATEEGESLRDDLIDAVSDG